MWNLEQFNANVEIRFVLPATKIYTNQLIAKCWRSGKRKVTMIQKHANGFLFTPKIVQNVSHPSRKMVDAITWAVKQQLANMISAGCAWRNGVVATTIVTSRFYEIYFWTRPWAALGSIFSLLSIQFKVQIFWEGKKRFKNLIFFFPKLCGLLRISELCYFSFRI